MWTNERKEKRGMQSAIAKKDERGIEENKPDLD